jgi:hypothetical protein
MMTKEEISKLTPAEIYNDLAQSIVNSITEDWKSATLDIECLGAVGFALEYINSNDEIASSVVENGFENSRKVKRLQEIMKGEDENRPWSWNKVKFMLTPDGRFNTSFEWDEEYYQEVLRLSQDN